MFVETSSAKPDRDLPQPRGREFGIRLPLHLKQMGDPQHCNHRCGWRHVVQHLGHYQSSGGILLDDFVERSFQHAGSRQTWREPWVGIFHHPPNLPGWLDPTAVPRAIFSTPEFQDSHRYLRGIVALSGNLGHWLGKELGRPVLVLKHPTEIPPVRFSLDAYLGSAPRQLVQVGWYGRNQRAIYQVPAPARFRKVHLLQDRPWVRHAIAVTDQSSPYRDHDWHGVVKLIREVSNTDYDDLLSRSIVFCQYWDVSASNTIVECIARNTPIVVNRHEAVVEYLGPSYPLYYDTLSEVEALIGADDRITAAHLYLSAMDKSWLCASSFSAAVNRFVQSAAMNGVRRLPELGLRSAGSVGL
jgi:hypothetical protein